MKFYKLDPDTMINLDQVLFIESIDLPPGEKRPFRLRFTFPNYTINRDFESESKRNDEFHDFLSL